MRAVSLIEPLEDRIAPATVVSFSSNLRVATYTDATGDLVHVTLSKGTFLSNGTQFTFDSSGDLTELNLTTNPTGLSGANLTFTVKTVVSPGAGGSTTVNIGEIDAAGISLGNVTIPGDLGSINVGSTSAKALGTLTVNSLGAVSSTTGESSITGSVGAIDVISGNVEGTVFVQGYNTSHPGSGNIGHLNIKGSLDGGNSSVGNGDIFFTGTLGSAVIGGGIEGGSADYSGSIGGYDTVDGGYGTFSKIGSIKVNGSVPDDPNPSALPGVPGTSILGGAGAESGAIAAVSIGTAFVAGDVTGGTGLASGAIQAGQTLSKVTVAGSLIGGNFTPGSPTEAGSSGLIFGGNIGSVLIGKSIYGGSGIDSGQVGSVGRIQSVKVMGNLVGGSAGTSSAVGDAGIISANSLGTVAIQGSVIGGNTSLDPNQAGNTDGGIVSSISIGNLSIGGNVAGGSGAGSGFITVEGPINVLNIGGSLLGGTANNTGNITTFGVLKSATIHGGVTGSNSLTTMLTNTGYIQAAGIGTMVVDGALTAGTAGSGGLDTSGAIRSTTTIGSLTVGSLVGNSTNPAIISAVGQANLASNATSDVAIGNITIGLAGSTGAAATYADILAGYSTDTSNGTLPLGTGVNADAQIGTVRINGAMTATNIIAGVGAGTTGFGTSGSGALTGTGVTDLSSILSKISNVIITGKASASSGSYGIAAQYIASASYDGSPLALKAGPDNDTFALSGDHPLGANEFLYEV